MSTAQLPASHRAVRQWEASTWVGQPNFSLYWLYRSNPYPPFFFGLHIASWIHSCGGCAKQLSRLVHTAISGKPFFFFSCSRCYHQTPCGRSLGQAAISPAGSQKLLLWGEVFREWRGSLWELELVRSRRQDASSTDHSENSLRNKCCVPVPRLRTTLNIADQHSFWFHS